MHHTPSTTPPTWDRWNPSQRRRVLLLVSTASFLVPISTTIYLPSLSNIQSDFSTTATAVALTLSLYTLAAGLSPLIYGPLSDRFGRRTILLFALTIYVTTSAMAGFSWSINSLAGARFFQAIGVSSAMVVGVGAIADVYPPHMRGRALGLMGVAPLLGPLFGPPLGGLIAAQVGWRGVFWVLTIFGGIVLTGIVFLMPETLEKGGKKRPLNPLSSFTLLKDRGILLLALNTAFVFMSMYYMVTLFPFVLSEVHGLNQSRIGFAFVPFGVGGLVGTLIGGRVADKIGHISPVLAGTIFAQFGFISLLYSFEREGLLWLLLGSGMLFAFGNSFARPGIGAAVIARAGGRPAAANGLIASIGLIGASLVAIIAPDLRERFGALGGGLPLFGLVLASLILLILNRAIYSEKSTDEVGDEVGNIQGAATEEQLPDNRNDED